MRGTAGGAPLLRIMVGGTPPVNAPIFKQSLLGAGEGEYLLINGGNFLEEIIRLK